MTCRAEPHVRCCFAWSRPAFRTVACLMSRPNSLLFRIVSTALAAFAYSLSASAADIPWPFRNGPTMNGHASAVDSSALPVHFSESDSTLIRWKKPLTEFGLSTPVIGAGRIWFTSANKSGTKQFVDCFDEDTGARRFHKLLFENETPEPLGTDFNTYASPSCALEADAVYVHFGEYGTARLAPETGEVVWERRDIKCRHYRGPGSSPVIFEDLLILTFDGASAQFLIALDKATGTTVWRSDRTTDYGDLDENGKPKREGDLRKAFGTPGFHNVDGRMQLVSVASRAAYGHDARTGEEIWTCRHQDFNAATPPAFFRDYVIINTGDRTANTMAIRLDSTTRGDVTDTHVKWDRAKGNARLATPLLIDDKVFMVTEAGVVVCLDADSGDEIWKGRIGGTHVASPFTANGLIYFCSEEGDTTVVRASDTFEVVAKNRLNDGMRASPAVAGNRLYLRTFEHLYCIGR